MSFSISTRRSAASSHSPRPPVSRARRWLTSIGAMALIFVAGCATSGEADPFENGAAAADAQAALGMVDDGWTFTLAFDAGLLGIACESWAPQVWERGELQVGDQPEPNNDYFHLSNSDLSVDSVQMTDVIDTGAPDPRLVDQLAAFRAGGRNADITEMSARELHLILAEHALANADTTTFASEINAVRTLDDLTDWDEGSPQVPAATVLEHERNVNLIWQGRRLADHYRFGSMDPLWQATSVARQNPGTLFPISITEIRSNPNVDG